MATETRKVLGQKNPGAAVTELFAVPAATQVVFSSVIVCNQTTVTQTFRLWVAVNNAADDPIQYLFYGVEVPAGNSFAATIGGTLGANDRVRCWASAAGVSFNAFGVEIA